MDRLHRRHGPGDRLSLWVGFNAHLAAQIAALNTQVQGQVIPSDVPGSLVIATPLGDPRSPSAAQPVMLGGMVDMTTVHDEAQVPSGGMK